MFRSKRRSIGDLRWCWRVMLNAVAARDASYSRAFEARPAAARARSVRFEDLYVRGMSRVRAFALSFTRGGGAKEALLPETWPAAVGPSGIRKF